MIFITLGTQDKPFTRLLDKVESLLKEKKIKTRVVVQAGCTKYKSKYMEIFELLPMDEFEKIMDSCDLLITHGGVGSIVTGLKKNKKVLAVARLKKYGEHTNDHQLQIIEEFSKKGYILPVNNLDDLENILNQVDEFKPKKYKSNTDHMVKIVEEQIEKLY